jgi:hypothetical protein
MSVLCLSFALLHAFGIFYNVPGTYYLVFLHRVVMLALSYSSL